MPPEVDRVFQFTDHSLMIVTFSCTCERGYPWGWIFFMASLSSLDRHPVLNKAEDTMKLEHVITVIAICIVQTESQGKRNHVRINVCSDQNLLLLLQWLPSLSYLRPSYHTYEPNGTRSAFFC